MRSVKYKVLILFIVVGHLFSTNLAWACSPRRSFDVVGRCTTDGKKDVLLSLPGVPADFEGDLALLQTSLNEFALQCEVAQATTEQVRTVFTAWVNRYSPDGKTLIYDNNTLIFEAYTPEREIELKTIEQTLHICNYYESERVGDWLILASQYRRDYCGANIIQLCAQDVHLASFLFDLITQPSLNGLPYLALFVLLTGLGTTFFYQLLNYKLIKLGFLVNLFFMTPFTLCLLSIWPQKVQLAGWVLSCYLLAYGWYAFQRLKNQKNKELSQINL